MWILLVTLMTSQQASMTSVVFSDEYSCQAAGVKIVDVVNMKTPIFKKHISYECIKVSGVK